MAGPDGGPEGRGLERAREPTPAVERTPAQHPVSWGSSGAPDPGGPQSLAGPTALLGSAGLLRCASARPPLEATSGLDSGDGRSASRPVIRVLGREPQPHGLVCFVMFSFPRFRRGQGLAMTPARRRDRGSRGRDAGGGGRAASKRVAMRPAPPSGPAAL